MAGDQDNPLKPTCDIEYGILNPPVNHDDKQTLDIDNYDPTMLVSKVAHDAAYKVERKKDNTYQAVVMRIDENVNGYCEVKARIPELDGSKPEPAEFVDRWTESNSHYAIDMHRSYSWRGPTPKIGSKITCAVPDDMSSQRMGTILATDKDNYVAGRLKSSKLEATSEVPAADSSIALGAPPGDDIGGGSMDGQSQVPPYGNDDELYGQSMEEENV